MKKSELRGLGNVYKYTVTQTLKTKSFIITTIILVLFAGLVFPILNYINSDKSSSVTIGEGSEANDDGVEIIQNSFKVYINNNSGIKGLDYDAFRSTNDEYKQLVIEETTEAASKVLEEAAKNEEEVIFLEIKLEPEKARYNIVANYTKELLSENETKSFAGDFTDWFTEYKRNILELTEEKEAALSATFFVSEVDVSEYINEDEVDILSSSEYNIVYALIMVMYFLVVFAASSIANKVVEEKANRVVEYLLTTVRPMALILGKVLATLTITIGQITIIAVAAVGSNIVSANLLGMGGEKSAISMLLSFEAMERLNIINLIIFIIVSTLGILIFGLLAGLCGATVSKMEDIQQGLRVYNIVIVVCFIIDIVACELMWTVGLNAFTTFTIVCPLTAPFILPGALVVGRVGVLTLAISVVLLVATAAIVLKFVSMVYEAVIVMNGDPLSFGRVIKIAKDRRKKA